MIPFNKPCIHGSEIQNILDAVSNGQLAGDGPYTQRCESLLSELVGVKSTLLTHSCTAALEMAAILLNLGKGDEVIMPSYTFVSTANAVVLRGATPVFVDVRADTLNIDERLIEQAITPRTKAIFVVHYGGVVCNMDAVCKIAKYHNLYVVEDAAQALTSSYKDRAAGSFGDLSCFSFHETKNIISGEGGCLCINNERFLDRAEIIREKGTNRRKFFKGLVDKYTWVDLGSSYIPGELIAAFLFAQLEKIDEIQAQRFSYWDRYLESLSFCKEYGFNIPYIPDHVKHNAHLFYLVAPSETIRSQFIATMKSRGVLTPFHYVPLHSSPAGQKYCKTDARLEVTEDISQRLVRLPLYPDLASDQDLVIQASSDFLRSLKTGSRGHTKVDTIA